MNRAPLLALMGLTACAAVRGLLGASFTSGGTGFQIESPLVGLRLGLREGIELHLFALAFGIDFWSPALIVPFEDGRVGFADW